MGVISYLPDMQEEVSLERYRKLTKKMTPAEKRHVFVNELSRTIRADWLKDRSE